MNVETVDNAGIQKLKWYHTVNIDMFRHPKYYKELRKLRNKEARVNDHSASISDQAISLKSSDENNLEHSPGPGHKHQASSAKQQASSESKPEPSSGSQASSDKL